MTYLIKRTEQRLDKSEIISKVDKLETKHNSLKKKFKKFKSSHEFICIKFDKQEKNSQSYSREQRVTKRKQSAQQNDKAMMTWKLKK